ncbi:hypothetical protein VP01_768g3 [Puccinia sorghi]|uniref:Uncharacterized protein n=1 Tax=Puccinia sorghi TaxID=27349 RepID=A0A0L6UBL1_9BASI|nr:hypothetical protein VP01_768g3 [Puccinia sorghi]
MPDNPQTSSNPTPDLWRHLENNWIQQTCDPSNLNPPKVNIASGCGLILTMSQSAREFQQNYLSTNCSNFLF